MMNELPEPKAHSLVWIFFSQLRAPFSLVLLIAVLASLGFGKWKDAIIIGGVIFVNAMIGMLYERRANNALAALKKSFVATCRVRRKGEEITIPTREVKVGDVLILHEGDQVAADAKITLVHGLQVDESMLTGESIQVSKTDDELVLSPNAPLGDRRNMVFAGTLIVVGSGEAKVTAIGPETQMGKIAAVLQDPRTDTPLVAKMKRLSKQLLIGIAVVSLVLFLYSLVLHRPISIVLPMLLSLSVSVIPEGLPMVVTVVLARAVAMMAKKRAIVKHLFGVEGLSDVDVLCTDKTGTLTKNELVVHDTWKPVGVAIDELVHAMFGMAQGSGDAIDRAFIAFALKREMVDKVHVIEEQPFDYKTRVRKRLVKSQDEGMAYMAGSPESILEMSHANGDAYRMLEAMTQHGLRVIGLARATGMSLDTISSWTFIGLVGLKDEAREGTKESVTWCQAQGIQVMMLTGDHPETAFAIGKELGIAKRHAEVLVGHELDMLTDVELTARFAHVRIFARINPLHKKRIVELLRKQGKRVAVTGDGVNDAPALHLADIGIAMGKSGTDVARAASDLILTDDHFATIVSAIQEARAVMARVRRVIQYLLSTNATEVIVVGIILILGLPIPLLPVQILWLNVITDVALDVALAMEPHRGSLRRQARSILDGKSLMRMGLMSAVMALTTFLAYGFGLQKGDIAHVQSLTLLALASAQWWNAWNSRSETTSIFRLSLFGNKLLVLMTSIMILLQLAAHYFAPLSRLLGTVPLTATEWLVILALSSSVLWVDELRKWYARRQSAIFA